MGESRDDGELGALVSAIAIAEKEPVGEYAMVSGRAMVAYSRHLRRLRRTARVLPRGDWRRTVVARETMELRAARRRSSYARMALKWRYFDD